MKRLLAAVLMVLLMAGGAFAANVVQEGKGFIYVKLDGSTDFVWSTATFTTGKNSGLKVSTVYPEGLSLTFIKYAPPSAGAALVVRDDSLTGAIQTRLRGITGDTLKEPIYDEYFHRPYIENDDQTTSTNAEVWFEFLNK